MFFYWTKSRTGQWFRSDFEDLTEIIIFSDKKPPLPDNFFSEPPPVMIHSWVRSAFLDEKTNCSASDIWSGENICQRCILEEVWNQFKFVLLFRNGSKPLLDLQWIFVSTDTTENTQEKKLRSHQPNWRLVCLIALPRLRSNAETKSNQVCWSAQFVSTWAGVLFALAKICLLNKQAVSKSVPARLLPSRTSVIFV